MTTAASARYRDPVFSLERTTEVIEQQLGHRSVRKFLSTPVSDAELTAIVAAAQSAATSSNLQPWSVIAVRDTARKTRLAELAGNQQFIADAPLFLVWIADLSRARRLAQRSRLPLDGADYLESTLIGFVDTALAAQNAVVAAESLGLGTVFVGAVRNRPLEIAAELRLPQHSVATFGLAVGVPDSTEDAAVKPRLPQRAVLHHEVYDEQVSDAVIGTYDKRLTSYNQDFGRAGDWSSRVVERLAGPASLSGRDELRQHLSKLGLPSD